MSGDKWFAAVFVSSAVGGLVGPSIASYVERQLLASIGGVWIRALIAGAVGALAMYVERQLPASIGGVWIRALTAGAVAVLAIVIVALLVTGAVQGAAWLRRRGRSG